MASPGHKPAVVLVRDAQSCLPLSKIIRDGDLIVLLTPVVAPKLDPGATVTSDPFEPLGRALARHHPWVRHVPYSPRGGITSTHVAFIKRATTVIFVVSGPPWRDQPSQIELGELVHSIAGHDLPVVTLVCPDGTTPVDTTFPTAIRVQSLSPAPLGVAADLLFQTNSQPPIPSSGTSTGTGTGPNVQNLISQPKLWPVEMWDARRDSSAVHDLWQQCLPETFHLSHLILQSLLDRDGYSRHYVVREPETGSVLGFCATYTTYVGGGGEELVGSLSVVLVKPSSRLQGIGLSLHDYALQQLAKTRGVSRLQLGSTFPRLLYGLPRGIGSAEWFRRRGWPIGEQGPEPGGDACDWLLRFDRWSSPRELSSPALSFRPCGALEFDTVLKIVEREDTRSGSMGWYDQYAKLASTIHVRDIIIAVDETETIVAAALTYTSNSGSPVADDLPWAATISADVGGVTCICIADHYPSTINRRDSIIMEMLDACIGVLSTQGMKRLFLDAVKVADQRMQSMGLEKWATYRGAWRDA